MINKYEINEEDKLYPLLQVLMHERHLDLTFVFFAASIDPTTGISWKIDCDRALPFIEEVLEQMEEAVHLVVYRITAEQYRDADFFLRQDTKINLRSLPTLTQWKLDECILNLHGIHCQNKVLLEEIFLEQLPS